MISLISPLIGRGGTEPQFRPTGNRETLYRPDCRSQCLRLPRQGPTLGAQEREIAPPLSSRPGGCLDMIEKAQSLVSQTSNDPSAGSPTETLLRLLLPLNDQVWESSRHKKGVNLSSVNPNTSLNHSIGSSDGRCVQRAGT